MKECVSNSKEDTKLFYNFVNGKLKQGGESKLIIYFENYEDVKMLAEVINKKASCPYSPKRAALTRDRE